MLINFHMKKSILRFVFLVVVLAPLNSWAWGRRGHQIVGETAAQVVSSEPESGFMRDHSFDIGYYANVPDFIWKRPETYGTEKAEHFMDFDIFKRELGKHPEVEKPFELSRAEFNAKFPEIKNDAGRAFWRIRELSTQLENTARALREMLEPTGPTRQKLQEKWLLTAGVMAHYVGDLGMPLHVSENYDGQMTGQKGIHGYFEETMVDQLYPELNAEVNRETLKQWPAFKKKNAEKTPVELLMQLTDRSEKAIPKLLAMDKKSKREELKKNAQTYRSLIRERMVDSSLVLAELYRRQLNWKFDGAKFYFFAGEPAYIQPGAPTAAALPGTTDTTKK